MYPQNWNLNEIFPGGSGSTVFHEELHHLRGELTSLHSSLSEGVSEANILPMQKLQKRLQQAESFTECLAAQDTKDEKAHALINETASLLAKYDTLTTLLGNQLGRLDEESYRQLLEKPSLAAIRFVLNEKRREAAERMDIAQESLANDLSVDGYQSWSDLYASLIGNTQIPYQDTFLSVGQADNKLDDANRAVRRDVFSNMAEAWKRQENIFAHVLNHIGGFRLNLYRHRGWDDILKEPLQNNRMDAETLQAMWSAILPCKKLLLLYMERKAQLLGLQKLSWYDLEAPLGQLDRQIPYEEAAEIILDCFRQVSPPMADFARMALTKGWVEAEDRPGKRPGGFCIDFPVEGQSRIFMTYGGTIGNLTTLAHELGHAYHSYVVREQPLFNRQYKMNVAETASTFAEQAVFESLLHHAKTQEEKLALLDNKLQRAVVFLMNIHARFLFETRFYRQRKEGSLSAAQLCGLMEEAQKEAFCNAFDEWHPYFWISKGHFYYVKTPFYNFPYTFGFLFSMGVYAGKDQPGFAEKYRDLLADTGRMTTEDLAREHLGVDLHQEAFWKSALKVVAQECESFLALSGVSILS